jgi:hypothetical protein
MRSFLYRLSRDRFSFIDLVGIATCSDQFVKGNYWLSFSIMIGGVIIGCLIQSLSKPKGNQS